MKELRLIPLMAGLMALAGCVTPVGPVEVTRFHVEDVTPLGKGTIAVIAPPGTDGAALEWQTYRGAVLHQLIRAGYSEAPAASSNQVAQVRLTRSTLQPDGSRSGPVSVGVGGTAGSHGTGVGLGVGINLSPGQRSQVATDLAVSIHERVSGKVLWEGRASFTVGSASPLAATGLAAPKMAEALFRDFPGISGETIEIR